MKEHRLNKGVVNRFLTNNAILWEIKKRQTNKQTKYKVLLGVSLNKSGIELAQHIACTHEVS